jgi:hypothetical protein
VRNDEKDAGAPFDISFFNRRRYSCFVSRVHFQMVAQFATLNYFRSR